ncbi:hypothetical protein GBAR_LOCUS14746 [Geodia barretti]|uniref:Uncharacterized protein n=1 Tax=Geodia barretti TaxID=519541 RepID=A0AA35S8R4_GEOBA|nr:hypothetical protein GBAR_LOCUS14746 [Geodia barretti]
MPADLESQTVRRKVRLNQIVPPVAAPPVQMWNSTIRRLKSLSVLHRQPSMKSPLPTP